MLMCFHASHLSQSQFPTIQQKQTREKKKEMEKPQRHNVYRHHKDYIEIPKHVTGKRMSNCNWCRVFSTVFMVPIVMILVLLTYIPFVYLMTQTGDMTGVDTISQQSSSPWWTSTFSDAFTTANLTTHQMKESTEEMVKNSNNDASGDGNAVNNDGSSVSTTSAATVLGNQFDVGFVLRMFVLIGFHILIILLLMSYFQIWFVHPGDVPDYWQEAVAKYDGKS